MTNFSEDQEAVLSRILARSKKMHLKVTPFLMGISMRANGHDLPLEEIKAWLIEHENDPIPEDRWITPSYQSKPLADTDQGRHEKTTEELKGCELKMTTEKTTPKNWFNDADELTDSDFIAFSDGDEKILKMVTNPVRKVTDYKQKDGTIKPTDGLFVTVLEGDNPKIKEWTITSKGLLKQLKATCIKEGIKPDQFAGTTWRINAAGMGFDRTYFMKILSKSNDAGQSWVEQQRAAAQEGQ